MGNVLIVERPSRPCSQTVKGSLQKCYMQAEWAGLQGVQFLQFKGAFNTPPQEGSWVSDQSFCQTAIINSETKAEPLPSAQLTSTRAIASFSKPVFVKATGNQQVILQSTLSITASILGIKSSQPYSMKGGFKLQTVFSLKSKQREQNRVRRLSELECDFSCHRYS